MGHSAGGNHVANYVFRPNLAPGPEVAGAILVSPSLPLDSDAPPEQYAPYFEGASANWSDIRLLENIEDTSTPVLLTVAQYDPDEFHQSLSQLFGQLVADGARPRLRQIPSHGHISYVTAIGTGDHVLVEEMLDFMLADW